MPWSSITDVSFKCICIGFWDLKKKKRTLCSISDLSFLGVVKVFYNSALLNSILRNWNSWHVSLKFKVNREQIIVWISSFLAQTSSGNILAWFQALDTFNTAVVSPIYYAMFTSFTIFASAIMFKVTLLSHSHIDIIIFRQLSLIICITMFLISCLISIGLFWSKCKQHSVRALWFYHRFIWNCCFAQHKRARYTLDYRYIYLLRFYGQIFAMKS